MNKCEWNSQLNKVIVIKLVHNYKELSEIFSFFSFEIRNTLR